MTQPSPYASSISGERPTAKLIVDASNMAQLFRDASFELGDRLGLITDTLASITHPEAADLNNLIIDAVAGLTRAIDARRDFSVQDPVAQALAREEPVAETPGI
jgi:hypothetical protein